MWLTLRYGDERLPGSEAEAEKTMYEFLRAAREITRKEGKKLRYVYVTANADSKTGEKTRLHHHVVMDRESWELVCALWPRGEVTYRVLDGRGDYTGVARYMLQNVRVEKGKQKWHAARGLKKPVYTEPVPVCGTGKLRAPKEAEIRESRELTDCESGTETAYLRYVRPERETEKIGGRKRKRGDADGIPPEDRRGTGRD